MYSKHPIHVNALSLGHLVQNHTQTLPIHLSQVKFGAIFDIIVYQCIQSIDYGFQSSKTDCHQPVMGTCSVYDGDLSSCWLGQILYGRLIKQSGLDKQCFFVRCHERFKFGCVPVYDLCICPGSCVVLFPRDGVIGFADGVTLIVDNFIRGTLYFAVTCFVGYLRRY